jgi:hypothetical protein
MEMLKATREEDRPNVSGKPPGEMSLDSLLGTWVNTNPQGRGIAKLVVSQAEGAPQLRVYGSGAPELVDWGRVPIANLYAKNVDSAELMAFDVHYNLGFMEIQGQANFSLGLLVLACFNTFRDESGRSNYFSREFFHREKCGTKNGEYQ